MQTEREYAEALFELAVEQDAVEEYSSSLSTIKELFLENTEYTDFLASPAIPLSERTDAIEKAFAQHMPEYVVSFLKIMCENGKSKATLGCIEEFTKLAYAFSNKTTAEIRSVSDLSDEQKNKLIAKLEKITGKIITPIYITDKSLIGGVKIDIDGKTFDGSIKHRLDKIKDVMNS